MGFCIFNHVAIAARYAQEKHKVGKILIVDWDVHHGNGTQDVFYDDESVFFFSTHQSPWYPGTGSREETGKGKGLGTILNRPLPAGSGKEAIVESAFAEDLAKAMVRYKPELIFISAGFDSRINDPLGQFRLVDRDFGNLTKIILGMAKEFADGKVISLLEGGYNLDGLGKAASAHAEALLAI
jgi:acetoin utilization deacetylase AcuC-like enzyme